MSDVKHQEPTHDSDGDNNRTQMTGLDPDTTRRTTQARSTLYQLITRFRKDASSTEDQEAKTVFSLAAEIIAGLSRAFREFESSKSALHSDNRKNDST